MSYIKVNTEYFNTNLNSLEILMLSVIESYTRDNKRCYQTNEQFAKMFNVSEKTIRNVLDNLEAKNYIKRNTEFGPKLGKANRRRTIELVHFKPEKKFEPSF